MDINLHGTLPALDLKERRDAVGDEPLKPSDIRDAFRILRERKSEGAMYASSINQTLGGGAGVSSGAKGRRIGIGR